MASENETQTYFGRCRCCLNYGYLKNMWIQYGDEENTEVYGEMLINCFALSWDATEDTLELDQICDDCITRLRDASSFKQLVLKSQEELLEECTDTKKICVDSELIVPDPSEEDGLYVVYKAAETDTGDRNKTSGDDPMGDDSKTTGDDSKMKGDETKVEADDGDDSVENVMDFEEIEFLEDDIDTDAKDEKKPKRNPKWPRKLPKDRRYQTYKQYSNQDLRNAFEDIKKGMHIAEACSRYNIPRKTLHSKIRDVPTKSTVQPNGSKTIEGNITRFSQTESDEHIKSLLTLRNLILNKKARDKNEIKEKRDIELKIKSQEDFKPISAEDVRTRYKAVVNAKFNKKGRKECEKETINELNKHHDNIKSILNNTNATMIKGYWVSTYHCNFCEQQTATPSELKQHNLQVHTTIDDPIKVKYVSDLVLRLDITDLNCRICGETIDTLENCMIHLRKHELTIHMDIKNHIIPFKFDSEEIRCVICKKEYKYFKLLSEHMSEHYRNYECPVCERGFINKQSMQTHSYRHNSGVFKCFYCPKVFDTRPKKSCHERLVHTLANKTRKCSYCDERFSTKDLVKSHEVKVHGSEPTIYSCQACNKSYTSQSSLMTHRKRFHLMLRPHKCSYCEMAFFSQIELRSHTVTHTKTRDFQCDICSKSFGTRCSLNQHVRGHLDDRRYKCEHCERAFVHRTAWKVHMRSKHGKIV